MARNHYEPENGVLALQWRNASGGGAEVPANRGVLLVEVWCPRLSFWEPFKPQVEVDAHFELWAHRPITGWHRIEANGDLTPIAEMPMVRRWASFGATRDWTATVALSGWEKQ